MHSFSCDAVFVCVYRVINPKDADRMANSVDADQTASRGKYTCGDLTLGPYYGAG